MRKEDGVRPIDQHAKDPESIADAVRRDFQRLIEILDERLASVANDDDGRPHVLQAKAAAVRGLELSNRLAGILRAAQ
jgi:hypothetical protein